MKHRIRGGRNERGALHRTQIYLEESQMRMLKLEAKRKQLAVSELIREAIDKFLKTREKRVNWDNDPLIRMVGGIKLNVNDASAKHDEYLCG
ncbi:MAG: ribbon-helix-helix protein, CopG family [Candidatus Omnitrophica bacterium]|nr:ribbon-helix-helix protein, CopG family [Candidatus Omnitrophota bacterium]